MEIEILIKDRPQWQSSPPHGTERVTKLSLQDLTNKWMWSTCTALGATVLLVSGLEVTNQIQKAWSSHGTCRPELWTNTSSNGSPDIPKIGELCKSFGS